MHTVLAITLAVIASLGFAFGATLQHLGVEKNFTAEGTDERALTFRRLMRLLVTPMWIGGLACIALSAGLHVIGLSMAPLSVIQPVGILAVPFSILLANRIHHTRTTAAMWGAVAVTVLGIVLFTYASAESTTHGHTPHWSTLLMTSGAVWLFSLVLALLAWKGPQAMKCLLWALAGAALYGLGSAYIKILTVEFRHGLLHPNFVAPVLLLAAAYAIGGWMIQQGYASGPAPIVVGSMTTFDPIVAVAFGLIVLREGRHAHWYFELAMIVGALAAVGGVFFLSKYHPDAVNRASAEAVESPAQTGGKGETA